MYYNNQYFNKHNQSKKLLEQILLGVELVLVGLPVVLDHLQELLVCLFITSYLGVECDSQSDSTFSRIFSC